MTHRGLRPRAAVAAVGIAAALLLGACHGTAGTDAVAVGGTFQFHSPGGKTEIFYPAEERQPLPNFSGPSLMEDDKQVHLDDFKDEIVVLNAWGSWCAPCRSESDDLQEIQEYASKHQGTVLGINVRDYTQDIAQDFVRDNGLTYPSIYDPPFKTAAQLGGVPAAVVPTTIVLDKQHRPAAVFLREITADEIIKLLGDLEGE